MLDGFGRLLVIRVCVCGAWCVSWSEGLGLEQCSLVYTIGIFLLFWLSVARKKLKWGSLIRMPFLDLLIQVGLPVVLGGPCCFNCLLPKPGVDRIALCTFHSNILVLHLGQGSSVCVHCTLIVLYFIWVG